MAGISAGGLGSGLDVQGIVSKLMQVEGVPLQLMQAKQKSYQDKISALNQLRGMLTAFQGSVISLESTTSFNAVTTSSSDATVATVSNTTSSGISDATYALNVTQLAQGQRLVTTSGWANTSSVIGGGTLTFNFGTTSGTTFTANPSKTAATVTIPPNSTLQGIADAVNQASIGVQASIVNDGINGNRLVYSTADTGAKNSLKVTADVPGGPLAAFTNDPAGTTMTQLQAAQDAIFTLNGLTIQKSSNTVTDAINGLSFTLKKTATPVTLTVGHDSSSATKQIQSFVDSYNGLNKTLKQVSAYDPTPVGKGQTRSAQPLNGDPAILSVRSQLRGMFNTVPPGLANNAYKVLADVGVTFDSSGTLSLDSGKLQKALNANPTAVAAVFGALGKPTDSQVSYSSSTNKTMVGTYAVNITNMQYGVLLGTPIPGGSYPISSTSLPAFTMSVDGVALNNVSWTAGQTYNNASQVASALQSTVNSALAAAPGGAGKSVTVSVDPNTGGLQLQSNSTGTTSSVTVTTGLASLGFADGVTNTGSTNVAGTIGGYAAIGSGNTLTGAIGTPVEGLSINISSGVTGDRGTVAFTKGVANALDSLLTTMTSDKGILSASVASLNKSIDTVGKQMDAFNKRLADTQQRYLNQFNAMDAAVGKLKSMGNFLSQQLAAMSGSSSSSSGG